MRVRDKKYRASGYKVIERITEYYMEDIINSDNIPLFAYKGTWKGYQDNYHNFLHKGKYKTVSPEYRYRTKTLLVKMVTKLYFQLLMEDLLAGKEVTISNNYDLFITNRSSNSPKYKFSKRMEFIPYIRFHAGARKKNGYYILYFSEKYQDKLRRLIKRGKRYKIKNE